MAVARALSNEPAVIMADEPTGNLDSTNGQHVIDLLFDVHARRGTTLVLVTHDAALAARADVQLSLRDGRVVPSRSRADAGVRARSGARLARRMGFVLRMVGREMRAAWRRLIFFFVCIAIGVGAIAAMRSVIDQVSGVLTREARAMTGADIVIQSTRPWDRGDHRRRRRGRPARARCGSRARSSRPRRWCGRRRRRRRRGWSSCWPSIAPIRSTARSRWRTGGPTRHALVAGHGVLVRPDLIAQLGLRVGGSVFIGQERFEIRGVISSEPGRRAGVFSLGPRVVIDRADLAATGLIGFGSRVSYQRLLQLPDAPLEPIVKRLRARLSNSFASVRSYRDTEERVRRAARGRAELPRPGRLRDRRPRRHRRVERDARLPAAEADQHRGAQVPRRVERADPRRLRRCRCWCSASPGACSAS